MKLSECKHGIIVQAECVFSKVVRVGMVVGITNNCPTGKLDEKRHPHKAIPLVQWSCGTTLPYHHENLTEYKD